MIYFFRPDKNMFTRERTIDASRATPKVLMSKPGIIRSIKSKSRALITKVNKPREIMFIGKVKTTRIGLRIRDNIPQTIDIMNKVSRFSTRKPGTR